MSCSVGQRGAASAVTDRIQPRLRGPTPLGTEAPSLPLAAGPLPWRGLRGPDLQVPWGAAQSYCFKAAEELLCPRCNELTSTEWFTVCKDVKIFVQVSESKKLSVMQHKCFLSTSFSIRIIFAFGPKSWMFPSFLWTTLCRRRRPFPALWRNASTPTAGLWTTAICWVCHRTSWNWENAAFYFLTYYICGIC